MLKGCLGDVSPLVLRWGGGGEMKITIVIEIGGNLYRTIFGCKFWDVNDLQSLSPHMLLN